MKSPNKIQDDTEIRTQIPLLEPCFGGNEWSYVKDCLDKGWVSSAGGYVSKFEEAIAQYVGADWGAACMNGTVGLQIALQVLGITNKDHVIVPNATFVASANSVIYSGAEPIFIDACEKDWQMDLDLLEDFLINECTTINGTTSNNRSGKIIKAIIIVHVYGQLCNMNRLMSIADRFGIKVLEDASESLGATYENRHSGTIGHIGVFSFNGNKIITTGGGGIIVSQEEEYVKKARHLIAQAKVKPNEYYHDEVGYNYRMVNVLAAIGLAQIEMLQNFTSRKIKVADFYRKTLGDIPTIKFQEVNSGVIPNYWLNGFISDKKNEIEELLSANQIMYGNFWIPMNELPMYQNHQYITKKNITASIAKNCICIPSSVSITESEQQLICDLIKSCFNS